jgi:hypothetical protein
MPTLREPFDQTHTKVVKTKQGEMSLTYISWSQVADRLDDAAPGWSFTIRQLGDDWCWGQLTIDGRTFDNIGYAENADQDWKKEALKDAVSDALKRCAALAGVGRYLYDKDAPRASQNGHTPPRAPAPVQLPTRPIIAPQRSSTAVPDDLDWNNLSPVKPGAPVLSGTVAVTDRPSLSEGENWCPVHGLAWVLKPAGTSKSGAPYDPFWACSSKDKLWCKEKPTRQWVEAHHP